MKVNHETFQAGISRALAPVSRCRDSAPKHIPLGRDSRLENAGARAHGQDRKAESGQDKPYNCSSHTNSQHSGQANRPTKAPHPSQNRGSLAFAVSADQGQRRKTPHERFSPHHQPSRSNSPSDGFLAKVRPLSAKHLRQLDALTSRRASSARPPHLPTTAAG